ncbi:MAG: prepilin-type N-terminal cleavage/methylation domain-containing protein [Congregibacter sp.]
MIEHSKSCNSALDFPLGNVERGFSLVELLVVVLVVVIIASLVTLNVGSGTGDRELERRVQTLRATAAYALDEAQFSGADFGLLFVADSNDGGDTMLTVHWRQRLPAGWRLPVQSVEFFSPLIFPASARVQLLLGDIEILLADAAAASPTSGVAPQWLLFSSGETQPGELIFRDRDSGEILWRLSWDLLGRFEIFRGERSDNEAAATQNFVSSRGGG